VTNYSRVAEKKKKKINGVPKKIFGTQIPLRFIMYRHQARRQEFPCTHGNFFPAHAKKIAPLNLIRGATSLTTTPYRVCRKHDNSGEYPPQEATLLSASRKVDNRSHQI
jgi:hypothetical protein